MDLREFLAREAEAKGVPVALAAAVMQAESAGNPNAVSRKGAIGPMQLMPGTARDLGVDPNDPYQNIRGGVEYLRRQLVAFNNDPKLALAAYNAGPGNVRKAGGVPNFPETQAYVPKVMNMAGMQDAARDDADIFADLPSSRPTKRGRGGEGDADIFADLKPQGPAPSGPRKAAAVPDESLARQAADGAVNFGRGAVRGVRDLVDSGAYLLPKGLGYVTGAGGLAENPVSRFFEGEARRVSDINKAAEADYQKATEGSIAAGVGRVGGNIATSFVPGFGMTGAAEKANAAWQAGNRLQAVGRAAALGGAQGVLYGTRTEDDSVLKNALGGAAGGAAGQVVTGAIGSGIRGIRNMVAGDDERAGRILLRAADDPAALQRALQGGGELVPGSVPTLPQLAQDAGISQLYRTTKNAGVKGFADREAEQNAARLAALGRITPEGRTSIEAAEIAGNVIKGEAGALRDTLKEAIRGAYNVPELQNLRLPLSSAKPYSGMGPPLKHPTEFAQELDGILSTFYPGKPDVLAPSKLRDAVKILRDRTAIDFPELQKWRKYAADQAYSLGDRDPTASAAYGRLRDLLDSVPDRLAQEGRIPAAAVQAFDQAKGLRRTLGERYDTGAARNLWRTGSDGQPMKQGAEVAKAFFNSGASQRADAEQFLRMSPGNPTTRDALRDYAITDLREKATTAAGELSPSKFNAWINQRAEAARTLMTPEERDTLNRISADLFRADRGERLGMAKGSPTAQNLLAAGMLDSPALRTALRYMPVINRVTSPILDAMAERTRQANAEAVGGLLLNPELARLAVGKAQQAAQGVPLWNNRIAPGLLSAGVPATTGLLGLVPAE